MILLTGGAGFIGSCFLKKLNDNGFNDIVIVDRLGTGDKWKNLVGKKFARFVHKDEFLKEIENNSQTKLFEAIVHIGACSSTTEKDADYIIKNNFNYSVKLAEYAAMHDIPFVYASSAATYGNGENGYDDQIFDNLRPMNVYGYSKHAFDLWVRNQGLDKKFVGLKYFNVFGPNEYHKDDMASMVFKAYNQIVETGKVKLFKSNHADYKDGEQMRDFVYVKDAVDLTWFFLKSLLDNQPEFAGIYNIGSGKARSWNDLIKAIFAALQLQPKIEYINMPEELENQYQYYTQADMKQFAKKSIKLRFTSLEDSVKDYVCNYLKNEWKYL